MLIQQQQQHGHLKKQSSKVDFNSRDAQSSPITPTFVVFVCNSSFSLQSAPPPGRGPLPSPLIGGFPSTSLLIGQHAASLQLAQLKTQLALTQINSALAVGSHTPAFKANSKTRTRYKHLAAPSPTAVAINLLNLLKIANNMSRPPYSPCGSGSQRIAQRQYDRTNTQPETARLGADSSFSSPPVPGTYGSIGPSLTSLNYGLIQTNSVNETILRSEDMHNTRAREVRALAIPVQQTNQDALFPSRDSGEIGPHEANKAFFQMASSSAPQGHGGTCVKNESRSLEWLNYKRPPDESTSASLHGGEHNVPYIPGLSDDSHMVPEELSGAPSFQPRYSTETATSILRQYGLDNEDLEYLISYPEDQMTLANMQIILQQRSLEKTNRAMAVSQTKTYSEPQPTTSASGPHSHASGFSVETGLSQKGGSATLLQQSKVIDYGHTRRYKGGASDGDGTTSDGAASSTQSRDMLPLDPCHGSRLQPQEKNRRGTNDSSSSSSHMSGLNTLGPFTKPLRTSEKVPSSSPLPTTEKDTNVVMSKSTKAVPIKEPQKVGQSPLKPPTSCVLLRGMHPGRPGLVLISRNKSHPMENKQDQTPQVVKQVVQQPVEQQAKPQMPKEPLLRTVIWPPAYSAGQQLPPAPNTSRISEESWATHQSLGNSQPLDQPFQTQVTNSDEQPRGKVTPLKGLPTLPMMHDYAATSPRVFPHTCSLCYKECAGMKVSRRLHSVVPCPLAFSVYYNRCFEGVLYFYTHLLVNCIFICLHVKNRTFCLT